MIIFSLQVYNFLFLVLGIPDANARGFFLLVSAMKREKPQSVISNAGCIGYYNIISQMFFWGVV